MVRKKISLKVQRAAYKNKPKLISNFDCTLLEAEVVGLIGRNGCGKSTLFNIFEGTASPDLRYSCEYDTFVPVGHVPQNLESVCFDWLSVFENIRLGARDRGGPFSHDELERLIAFFPELDGASLRSFPKEVSGGQRQMMILAREMLRSNKLILLDEAFSAIDPHNRREIMSSVRKHVQDNNMFCLTIFHSVDDALLFCDRIIILNKDPLEVSHEIHLNGDRLHKKEAVYEALV